MYLIGFDVGCENMDVYNALENPTNLKWICNDDNYHSCSGSTLYCNYNEGTYTDSCSITYLPSNIWYCDGNECQIPTLSPTYKSTHKSTYNYSYRVSYN